MKELEFASWGCRLIVVDGVAIDFDEYTSGESTHWAYICDKCLKKYAGHISHEYTSEHDEPVVSMCGVMGCHRPADHCWDFYVDEEDGQ